MPHSSWRLARPPGENRGACVSLASSMLTPTCTTHWACGFTELTFAQGSPCQAPSFLRPGSGWPRAEGQVGVMGGRVAHLDSEPRQ